MSKKQYMIGDVYMMTFKGTDSEQFGRRPAVIIQNNKGNRYSPNLIVCTITKAIKKPDQPTHVFLPSDETGLRLNSIALCENPVSISKSKAEHKITTLPAEYMAQIAEATVLSTSLLSFLPVESLKELWNRAIKLNAA